MRNMAGTTIIIITTIIAAEALRGAPRASAVSPPTPALFLRQPNLVEVLGRGCRLNASPSRFDLFSFEGTGFLKPPFPPEAALSVCVYEILPIPGNRFVLTTCVGNVRCWHLLIAVEARGSRPMQTFMKITAVTAVVLCSAAAAQADQQDSTEAGIDHGYYDAYAQYGADNYGGYNAAGINGAGYNNGGYNYGDRGPYGYGDRRPANVGDRRPYGRW